jgi:hypothetical protein
VDGATSTAPPRLERVGASGGVQPQSAHVRRYVDAGETPTYPKRGCPADLTEAQAAYLVRRLATCDKLRATTLYREIKELGYEASYVSFARRVRLLRSTEDEIEETPRKRGMRS